MIYKKLKKYWNIRKKVTLTHQDGWNGETIIPIHNDSEIGFRELKHHNEYNSDDVVVDQIIERKYGDLLKEERRILNW